MAHDRNPFILAADNSPALLPLLRDNPALASTQDEHGYSLVHAAASYNHLDLLRALVREFHVSVNLKDEDNETALFVVETVDAARVLVEELAADVAHRGLDGLTAAEKIGAEGTLDQTADIPIAVDPGFRRRIEELAQRDDFHTHLGQADLRKLIEDAIMDQGLGEDRNLHFKHA